MYTPYQTFGLASAMWIANRVRLRNEIVVFVEKVIVHIDTKQDFDHSFSPYISRFASQFMTLVPDPLTLVAAHQTSTATTPSPLPWTVSFLLNKWPDEAATSAARTAKSAGFGGQAGEGGLFWHVTKYYDAALSTLLKVGGDHVNEHTDASPLSVALDLAIVLGSRDVNDADWATYQEVFDALWPEHQNRALLMSRPAPGT